MDFALSEEQQELVATVRSLLAKRADSAAVRSAIDTDAGYDPQLWGVLCEQIGAAGLAIPEELDGAGFTLFESLLVLEEVGRSLAPSPLLSSLIAAEALLAGGDADARQRLLPRIATGETVALALDGAGAPVLDGDRASIVLAIQGDDLIEVTDGTARWAPTMDQTIRLARLDLAGAGTTRIGDGTAAGARARLVAAVGVAALATGLSSRALEMTVDYTKQRVQFGRPIGSFQALKHRMADMLVLAEMSRSASWAGAEAVSSGTDRADRLAHVAASYCCEALSQVAAETIQLHGGIAITWEHDAHLIFKRAHALGQLFGTPREHRALLALRPT